MTVRTALSAVSRNEEMTELQRAAKKYAELGFSIFPLRPNEKIPLTKNGLHDATSDYTVIQQWWTRWPEANIGLVTGRPNGFLVIDLDVDEAKKLNGAESLRVWQKNNGEFPESWRTVTGRNGRHLFYRTAEIYKNRVGILPGVDVRADGGYIVAPPSRHPNGNCYRWERGPEDGPLAEMNDTVKAFLQTGAEKQRDAKKLVIPEKVPEGERNATMFRLACSLQAKGLSDAAIYAACARENEQRFIPPLDEKEMNGIIRRCTSVFRKGRPIFFDAAGEAVQGRREPQFQVDIQGHIRQTIDNAKEAIQYDEQLYGKIRFNEISYAPYVSGALPWDPRPENFREWDNFDDSALKGYIETKYGLKSGQKCMEALDIVLTENRFNPVRDRLEEIWETKWDRQEGHIRKLLPEYLGAEDCRYNYEVMRIFMLGAISRAFHPGAKFDYMMVLVGEQGIGKSIFLRYLSMDGGWFSDNFNSIEGDKASEKLRGMWIVELAELLAAKRVKDQEAIKAFLTSTVDTYRAPYGRRTEQRPRMCVFAGTTNSTQFLTDPTGARRYLPVETSKQRQRKQIMEHRDEITSDVIQAWGEAMDIYKKADGKLTLKLPEEIETLADKSRDEHSEDDPRIGMIQEWLNATSLSPVCAAQLYMEALEHDRQDWTRKDITEIHFIMQNRIRGWKRTGSKSRCGRYGVQLCYVRDENTKTDPAEPGRTDAKCTGMNRTEAKCAGMNRTEAKYAGMNRTEAKCAGMNRTESNSGNSNSRKHDREYDSGNGSVCENLFHGITAGSNDDEIPF